MELLAPHSGVLARLCVMCILATMDKPADPHSQTLKRRHSPSGGGGAADATTGDDDATASPSAVGASAVAGGDLDMDSVGPMLKSRKLDTGNDDPTAALAGGDFLFDLVSANVSRTPPVVVQEPLQCTMVQLFWQFGHFLCVDQLSPKMYFIAQFLQLLVQLGGDQVKPLLRLAPATLMQNLLRVTVCDEYTAGFILR